MQTPIQIAFRDMNPSAALEAAIASEAEHLEQFFDRITSCRVAVCESTHRGRNGRRFSVHITMTVPGETLIVSHDDPEDPAHHADAYASIHRAFHAARRELQDYVRRLRGEVKAHAV